LIVRIGAAVVTGAALCAGAKAESAPIVPVTIEVTPLESVVLPAAASELSAPGVAAAGPSVLAAEAAGTAIPLPPGVFAGLIGLASAAVARHRYLKRR
jgi:hypothetical protein